MSLSVPLLIARLTLTLALSGAVAPALAQTTAGDWPGYNRTLTGERFSPLKSITPANVAGMRQICVHDLGGQANLQTGPIVAGGLLVVTTAFDTVALDAATCAEKWRTTEEHRPGWQVNRGAAYLAG